MTSDKDAGAGSNAKPPPATTEQTPFLRFVEFARRIIAVPKSEMDKKRRAKQRRKNMDQGRPIRNGKT